MLRSNLSMSRLWPTGQGQAGRGKQRSLGFNGCELLRPRAPFISPSESVKAALREHQSRIRPPAESPAHVRHEFIEASEVGVRERCGIWTRMRMTLYKANTTVMCQLDEPRPRGVG